MPKKKPTINWGEEAEEQEQTKQLSSSKYLKQISKLVRSAGVYQKQLDNLQDQMDEVKASLKEIVQQQIPDLFAEAGLNGITTSDGDSVEIEELISASLTKERKEEALEWLRENGYGDLIKSVVSVDFKTGEDKKRAKLLAALAKNGYSADTSETVHGSTLKSWIKGMIAEGKSVPEKTFSLYVAKQAKIKFAKPKL